VKEEKIHNLELHVVLPVWFKVNNQKASEY
jgi:hypothetical protein